MISCMIRRSGAISRLPSLLKEDVESAFINPQAVQKYTVLPRDQVFGMDAAMLSVQPGEISSKASNTDLA